MIPSAIDDYTQERGSRDGEGRMNLHVIDYDESNDSNGARMPRCHTGRNHLVNDHCQKGHHGGSYGLKGRLDIGMSL